MAVSLAGCGGPPAPDAVGDSLPTAAVVEAVPIAQDSAAPGPQTTLDSLKALVDRLSSQLAILNVAVAARLVDTTARRPAADSSTAERTVAGVRHYGIRTIFAFVVLLVSFALVRGLSWIIGLLAERRAARRLFYMRFVPIVRVIVYVIAVYYILAVVYDVDKNGILAASAAVGVGVGFASQGVIKNFFGGLVIIFDQPFQVGDKVAIGGTYGEIVNIGLRVTRLVTPDDSVVSVPNSAVVEGHVSNANSGALDCQVVVDLYLPGWIDVTAAKEIARSAAVMSRYAHLEKPVVVLVKDEFRETFITHLKVKAYVLDTRYEFLFASDVTETAKAEFVRQGLLEPGLGARTFLDFGDRPPARSRSESSA